MFKISPKMLSGILPIMLFQCSHYAYIIMLLDQYHFLHSILIIGRSIKYKLKEKLKILSLVRDQRTKKQGIATGKKL